MKKNEQEEAPGSLADKKKQPYHRRRFDRSSWNRYLNIDDWPEELEEIDLINDSDHYGELSC